MDPRDLKKSHIKTYDHFTSGGTRSSHRLFIFNQQNTPPWTFIEPPCKTFHKTCGTYAKENIYNIMGRDEIKMGQD